MSNIDLDKYLSPALKRQIGYAIATNESYKKLQDRHKECLKKHDYLGAVSIAKMLDEVQMNVVQSIINHRVVEEENVIDLMRSMSEDDQMRLSISLNIILFCIDQIDFHITESNEIIKKYYPDCRLEMYDNLNKVGKEVKEQMKYLGKNERIGLQIIFSDIADNLTDMLVNKVKAYIRKKKQVGEIV